MAKGIAFALIACFIWGLIFVVPEYMEGFTPVEIALGRYFFYGVVSLFILLKMRIRGLCDYPSEIWKRAFKYSLVITIFYYTCIVLAVQHASPAICALVIGISPITIAIYGNLKQKECSYKSLILPSLLIIIGLVVINAPKIAESKAPGDYLLGLTCSFMALMAWSWYVVANSHFLKSHPEVATHNWSTLIGVATFCWVVVFSVIVAIFFEEFLEIDKHFKFGLELTNFLIGCAVLGLLCSWLGAFFWNTACLYLPVPLAGQLTIFETIFGLFFVYLLESSFPPVWEMCGITLLITAIGFGIRASLQAAPQSEAA